MFKLLVSYPKSTIYCNNSSISLQECFSFHFPTLYPFCSPNLFFSIYNFISLFLFQYFDVKFKILMQVSPRLLAPYFLKKIEADSANSSVHAFRIIRCWNLLYYKHSSLFLYYEKNLICVKTTAASPVIAFSTSHKSNCSCRRGNQNKT